MSRTSSCSQCRAVARQSVFALAVFGISFSCGCAPSGSLPGNAASATPAAPEVKWGEPVDGLQMRLSVDFVDFKGFVDFRGSKPWLNMVWSEIFSGYSMGWRSPQYHLDVRNVSDRPIQIGMVTGGKPFRLVGPGGEVLDGYVPGSLTSAAPPRHENLLPPGKQMSFAGGPLTMCFEAKKLSPGTYTLQWLGEPAAQAFNGRVPPLSSVRFTIKAKAAPQPVQWLDGHAWSQTPGSLQTRLTAPAREFVSGAAIPMHLELRNVGVEPVRYYGMNHKGACAVEDVAYGADAANGMHRIYEAGGLHVVGPDGKELAWRSAVVHQRGSSGPTLRPGERVTLNQFNLASYYHMRKPGKYTVRYRGHAGHGEGAPSMPPSQAFEIEVGADRVSQTDGDPVGKILSVLPDDWGFWGDMQRPLTLRSSPGFGWSRVRGTGSIALVHKSYDYRSISPDSVAPAYLWLTRERAVPVAIHARRWGLAVEYASSVYLGGNNYYHVYIHVPKTAAKVWPTIKADLRRALRALEKP
jgi:hypothetical protein